MLAGLAVVIALLFASLWLLKRLSAPRGPAGGLL
ncbi:MAG: flagellar biosynthesis protein FliO, partial [Rhodocyclaceae bacterium]|nr:flagellar biosynthesis protein FliO [Rhodocyclaceae bacterium]